MMPQLGPLKNLKDVKVDENEITRIVAIIDSMTPKERDNHMIINGARRRRIAKGSGATVQEVNTLLKQYAQTRKMMKSFTGGGFLGKRLGKLKLPPGLGKGLKQDLKEFIDEVGSALPAVFESEEYQAKIKALYK